MASARFAPRTSASNPTVVPPAIRVYAEDLEGVGVLATVVLFLALDTILGVVVLAATLTAAPDQLPVFLLGGR